MTTLVTIFILPGYKNKYIIFISNFMKPRLSDRTIKNSDQKDQRPILFPNITLSKQVLVRHHNNRSTTPLHHQLRPRQGKKTRHRLRIPDVAKWVNNTFRLMRLQGPRCKLPSISPSVLKGFTFDCQLNPNYRFFFVLSLLIMDRHFFFSVSLH